MIFNLKNYLKEAFAKGTTISDYNLKALVIVGTVAHPLFAALHLYVFNMPWDSMMLKTSAGLICLLLATKKYWPNKLKPLFPFYWHFMLIYNLSFLITLTALNNHFIKTWFMWEVIMLYIFIMFVPHWLIFLIDLMIGVDLAFFVHRFTDSGITFDSALFAPESNLLDILLYISTFIFAIISGLIFSYSNAKGIASQERARSFKSFAGSIAHELRNPLSAVNLAVSQLPDLVGQIDDSQLRKNIEQIDHSILSSVKQANNTINIILADLNEKPITEDQFSYLTVDKILPQIIDSFGYKSFEEKAKVRLAADNNFIFKAISERFTFIIYNLLKNSLYYAKQHPDLTVTIGAESRTIDDKKWNVIYVKDTGPGVPPEVLGRLFGDFYTSGKKEGTGLGLAFCKRNMQIFGGDIICESEYGGGVKSGWTKFSLLLPIISVEEIAKASEEINRKKILLVDDEETNLEITKSRLEAAIPAIMCDTALNSEEALKLIGQNHYHLILLDIQMPGVNGAELAKKIKNLDQEIPIIAFTSLDTKEFDMGAFNYYLSKSDNNQSLYRNISKWLTDIEDGFAYLGNKEDYLQDLHGKRIILADDEQTNRMLTKRFLERSGLVITEAGDGKELLEIYQKSLDQNGRSSFDMILTDINMPPFNGDEAVKQIRKIEAQNNITTKDEIPIIALSGDGQKEDIHYFFRCQMTDYFIKGTSQERLMKIMANYLGKKEENEDFAVSGSDNNSNNLALSHDLVNQNQSVIDFSYISSFTQEEQKELILIFIRDLEKNINKIKNALKQNNNEEISFALHAIKGMSGNIGAMKLYNYLQFIQPQIKKSGKLPDNQNWLEELENIYDELKNKIKEP